MNSSICVFGDSIAKGVIFDTVRQRYSFLKNCFINLFSDSCKIQVDNYSKFGCTIEKGLKILEKHEDSLSSYDYVLLEFGGNDCNFNWSEISKSPYTEHNPQTPVDKFKDFYSAMIDQIISFGGRPLMLNLPPLDAKKFFNWVSQGNSAENILHWLGDVDHIFRWHENYNNAVCNLANNKNIPIIDIRSIFLNNPDFDKLICEDGMHPSSLGHQLIYKKIKTSISEV